MSRLLAFNVCLLLIVTCTTGCWDRRELNELAIVVGLGIDSSPQGYLTTVQLVNAQEISSKEAAGYATPVSVYKAEGKTVFESLRRLSTKLHRRIYLSHLRIIVIGEELARKGISNTIDFMSRDHEMRTDFFVTVAREERAENVLAILTPLEKIPANKLYSSLEVSQKSWSTASEVTLDKLISDLLTVEKNPVVTGIRIVDGVEKGSTKQQVEKTTPDTYLQFDGMAAFRNDRLVGWLNEEESRGYNFTQGKVRNTVINVACPKGGRAAIELIRSKEKIRCRVDNGKPSGLIELDTEGNIGDVECEMDVLDPKTVNDLEKKLKTKIEEQIQAAVDKSQKKLKSDIIGFGKAIHRDTPKQWKRLKPDWQQAFLNLPVEIRVTAHIRRNGTITNPIPQKPEE